ncbi:MAG: histidine phosphatase family protein [Planctomycetota bacterium]|nr:MAG: histidine phosphatase family protein [Planctomycetota bacterium]
MKTLLLMRHAKSSWDDPTLTDAERPLNARGLQDAPRIARALQDAGQVPDAILCSTARRAVETAALVRDTLGFKGPFHSDARLYMATPAEIVMVVSEIPKLIGTDADHVLLVGHNPGLQDFVELVTGTFVRMPTAALVELSVPIASWSEFERTTQATLGRVWRPRELPGG